METYNLLMPDAKTKPDYREDCSRQPFLKLLTLRNSEKLMHSLIDDLFHNQTMFSLTSSFNSMSFQFNVFHYFPHQMLQHPQSEGRNHPLLLRIILTHYLVPQNLVKQYNHQNKCKIKYTSYSTIFLIRICHKRLALFSQSDQKKLF